MRIKKSITDRVNKTREKFRTALMNAIMELDAKWQEKAPYTTFTFENKVVLTKVKNGTRLQNFSADFCVINQIETEKNRGNLFLCSNNGEAVITSTFIDVAGLMAIYEEMKRTVSRK